jgi:hypothetical protein
MEATRFDFASFICKDDQKATAPRPPAYHCSIQGSDSCCFVERIIGHV